MGEGRMKISDGQKEEFVMRPMGTCSSLQSPLLRAPCGHITADLEKDEGLWEAAACAGMWGVGLRPVRDEWDRTGESNNVPEILSWLNLLHTRNVYGLRKLESLYKGRRVSVTSSSSRWPEWLSGPCTHHKPLRGGHWGTKSSFCLGTIRKTWDPSFASCQLSGLGQVTYPCWASGSF